MRVIFVWLISLMVLLGCSSTEPEPQRKSYVMGAPVCAAWVHASNANPTADYQACKYNSRGNEQVIEQCMKGRGWRMEASEAACHTKSYTIEQRQGCIAKSMVNGRIDHQLIARCLSVYTPMPSRPLNQDKLRNLLSACLSKKDKHAQQQCLNQASRGQ